MQKTETEPKDRAFRSVWVWAILGLFSLIFVVNYAFFSVAIGTSSGLVTEKYYKYGLQQNKFDKQYRTQKERGWQVSLVLDKEIHAHQPSLIRLTIRDKDNTPISGGHAELTAYRPSDAKKDIILTLEEIDGSGVYQANITLPIQGVWDMNLLFAKGEDKHMLNQRIIALGDGNKEPTTLEKIVKFVNP